MAWKLTLDDGRVVHEDDLTIGDVEVIEERTDLTWRQINPLRSASCAKAIISTMLQRLDELSRDDADAKVDAMKANAVVDMIDFYDPEADMPAAYENGVPPSGAETSTPT